MKPVPGNSFWRSEIASGLGLIDVLGGKLVRFARNRRRRFGGLDQLSPAVFRVFLPQDVSGRPIRQNPVEMAEEGDADEVSANDSDNNKEKRRQAHWKSLGRNFRIEVNAQRLGAFPEALEPIRL